MTTYQETYRASIENPEKFWLEQAENITWVTKPQTIIDDSAAPIYRWFPDGELNTCYNAVDRHVDAGRGEQTAIIYDSAMLGTRQEISYAELKKDVELFAGALANAGVGKGDRVLIYMPMIPQAHVAMLATARLGAVHSVVFGGFAPAELASRINDCSPTVIVTASGGVEPRRRLEYIPTVEKAIDLSASKPSAVLVFEREGFEHTVEEAEQKAKDAGGAVTWQSAGDAMAAAQPHEPVTVKATDPLYILYTSGTTGAPKGVVRDNGGHAVALAWTMKNIYDVGPSEVLWCASDVGWVVGHSYIVYGPLIAGATSVLYEGKPVGTPRCRRLLARYSGLERKVSLYRTHCPARYP